MRLTPSQIAVYLICGDRVHPSNDQSMPELIREGHDFLVKITGKDFGYDLQAWHDYLKISREGGYTYGRNIVLPRIMKAAIQSQLWQNAVRSLT